MPESELFFSFADLAFFCPLDQLMVKYLGRKLNPEYNKKYGKIEEPIEFWRTEGSEGAEEPEGKVVLPYAFSRMLFEENRNFLKSFKERVISFTGSLLPRQEEVIPELDTYLQKTGTVTVGLYPGFGKTVIGAHFACKFKLRTLILITMTPQIKQWTNTFLRFTDAKIFFPGIKKKEIKENPERLTLEIEDADVIVCMDKRLNSIPENIKKDIGLLIIDEAHQFCVKSRASCWLSIEPKYLILETATLKRPDDSMERMAYAAAGLWGPNIKNPKSFDVNVLKTGIVPPVIKNTRDEIDYSQRVKFLLMNEDRNAMVLNIIKREHIENKKKILCLTSEKDHAAHFSDLLKKEDIKNSTFYGSMSTYSDSGILIGTISKIGTGFDEETFNSSFDGRRVEVLIMFMTIKKFTTFEQTVGRVMRANAPTVYLLIDEDTISKNHLYLIKWYLKEYTSAVVNEISF